MATLERRHRRRAAKNGGVVEFGLPEGEIT
jgi:hypothetical protein